MATSLDSIAQDARFDVAVLGSGAAGMSAAVFAALNGARVLLVERTEYLGGTSAYSAATTWIPNTRHSRDIGADDSPEKVSGFLDRAVGNRSPKAMREAFLTAGPGVVEELETRTEVHFRPRPFHPDYLSEIEGATSFGRALEPEPVDAAPLGRDLHLIRPPIPEFTILGGMMIDRDDIAHLMKIGKSARSALYAAKLIGRYGLARLRHGRGTRMVMGNALIARFLLSAKKLGVTVLTETETVGFDADSRGVPGLTLRQN